MWVSGGHYPWTIFGIFESELGQLGIRWGISSGAGAISRFMQSQKNR
jgi:hypothetical protein